MTGEAPGTWFSGKSAIVTGAARGIGRATAELLSALGALVVAVDKDEEALRTIPGTEGFVPWVGDLADDDVEQMAEDIWQRHGPIQLLVNNVGIDSPQHFLDLSQIDFDRVFSTNLRGPWFFTKQIARRLVSEDLGGAIVFVSSLHDSVIRTLPHYSASKAAVAMLAKELANELAPSGIRVNAVSPGSIRTERNSGSGGLIPPRAPRRGCRGGTDDRRSLERRVVRVRDRHERACGRRTRSSQLVAEQTPRRHELDLPQIQQTLEATVSGPRPH